MLQNCWTRSLINRSQTRFRGVSHCVRQHTSLIKGEGVSITQVIQDHAKQLGFD